MPGVQGLQAATGLRSLRLGQLYPVTITSVLEAVSCMQQLTSLDAEALTAGWPASKVGREPAWGGAGCFWAAGAGVGVVTA